MAHIAYSYLRFSTPDQASGDSRRRQLAMAEKYAAAHHLTLDRQLSFRDLGVSAYRGRNAKHGALRAFLDAIEHNLVPAGSHLLIESLDRLSRDRILLAQALFLQILQAGVTIVTLVDQRAYSLDSINRNPLELIISLVTMMRANEESETKSQRIRAAFDIRRAQLHEKPWSSRCPGWLRLDKAAGKFVIVEERAEVVRRIFRDVLGGVSHQSLVRRLNEEGVPLFGHGNQKGKIWQKALIRHLLYTPTVVGTLVPFVSEWTDGVRRLVPQPAVENYYPSVVERADWERVQAKRAAWSAHYRNNVPKTGRANLLAGLSRCPYCDRALVLLGDGSPHHRYYMCRHAYNGTGCSDRWIRYPGIEDVLTIDIGEVIKSCPKPTLSSEARRHRLRQIRSRLLALRKRLKSIEADHAILRRSSRPVLEPSKAVRAEVQELLADRKRLRIDRPKWLDVTLEVRLERLRSTAKAKIVDRQALHQMLRALFVKVVVDWEHNQLVFHWQHGGQSRVAADMRPRRPLTDKRRSDRPRYKASEMAPLLPPVAR